MFSKWDIYNVWILTFPSIKISKETNDTIGDVVRKGQAACQQLPNKFPSNNGKSNRERHDPPDYMDKKKIMIVKKFLNLILSQIEEQKKIYIFWLGVQNQLHEKTHEESKARMSTWLPSHPKNKIKQAPAIFWKFT